MSLQKLKKLELIEAPISEMDQEAMDQILAGWMCFSFAIGTECKSFDGESTCNKGGVNSANYCLKYYGNGYCEKYAVQGV